MKVKILKDVTARIGGISRRCLVGEVIDIEQADADNLINGGYAEGTRAAVKVVNKPKSGPLNSRSIKGG